MGTTTDETEIGVRVRVDSVFILSQPKAKFVSGPVTIYQITNESLNHLSCHTSIILRLKRIGENEAERTKKEEIRKAEFLACRRVRNFLVCFTRTIKWPYRLF